MLKIIFIRLMRLRQLRIVSCGVRFIYSWLSWCVSMPQLALLGLLGCPVYALAHCGIYVGAESGYVWHTGLPSAASVAANSVSKQHAPIWELHIGYLYKLRPHFGLGFSVGRADYATQTYKFQGHTTKLAFDAYEFMFNVDYIHGRHDLRAAVGGARSGVVYHQGGKSDKYVKQKLLLGLTYVYSVTAHHAFTLAYRYFMGGKSTAKLSGPQNDGLSAVLLGWQYTFF